MLQLNPKTKNESFHQTKKEEGLFGSDNFNDKNFNNFPILLSPFYSCLAHCKVTPAVYGSQHRWELNYADEVIK